MIDYDSFQLPAHRQAMKVVNGELPCCLMVSPTGTGKTRMQARVLLERPGRILQVVPSIEIAYGFCEWLKIPKDRPSLEQAGVYTVKRLKNLLADCKIDLDLYDAVQVDEGHHSVDDTHKTVFAYCGRKPILLWTATHFRGTAKGTAELHASVQGNVYHVLTIPQAIKIGAMTLPSIEVLPLVDDELIDVSAGEFTVTKVEARTECVLQDVADTIDKRYRRGTKWDRPTMVAVSSVGLAEKLKELIPQSEVITADTPDDQRAEIFERLRNSDTLLIQINVVSEGVNIPELGRLIDLAPTMSPVKIMQLVGRVCRPKDPPPEWIVCNHNLLRHGYLWEGAIPPSAFVQARTAWAPDFKPSNRLAIRAIRGDLKSLGKFKPATVPLANGGTSWYYCFGVMDGLTAVRYGVLLNPAMAEPLMGVQKIPVTDGKKDFRTKPIWRQIKELPDIKGATSLPTTFVGDNALQWWKNAAKIRGLDPEAIPDAKTFQVLPFLTDLGKKAPQ